MRFGIGLIIGFILGGFFGVMCMALIAANKDRDYDYDFTDEDYFEDN